MNIMKTIILLLSLFLSSLLFAVPPLIEGNKAAPTQVVIIDAAVEDAAVLISGIKNPANTDIYVLDVGENGVEQISDILAKYQNLDAVHLFSHGGDGFLQLGNSTLNSGNVTQAAAWGSALTQTGDILLYGCHVAETATGEAFVDQLAEITQADVAASDDVTGNTDQGGDWVFERHAGVIESQSFTFGSYEYTFNAVTDLNAAHAGQTEVWLDANDIDGDGTAEGASEAGLSGSDVTVWVNKGNSGISDLAITDSGAAPTLAVNSANGFDSVSWTDDHGLITGYTNDDQDGLAIWAVYEFDTVSGFNAISRQRVGSSGTVLGMAGSNTSLSVHGTGSGSSQYDSEGAASATRSTGERYLSAIQNSRWTAEGNIGIGDDPGISGRELQGSLYEVLAFDYALSEAESKILGNYLSAKWGVQLAQSGSHQIAELYAGDENDDGSSPTGLDHDVGGIGRESDGFVTTGTSGGLTITTNGVVNTFLKSDGDYIMAGHNDLSSGPTNADTGDAQITGDRAGRIWYMDVTDESTGGGSEGSVSLSFDLADSSDQGLSLGVNQTYGLLYRSGTSGDFEVLAHGSRDGSVVSFNDVEVTAERIRDGYFTVGVVDSGVPQISGIGTDIPFAEGQSPQILDTGDDATLVDTDYAGGGSLLIADDGDSDTDDLKSDDALTIKSGVNNVVISGSDVQFNSTSIGTIDGTLDGSSGKNLQINFNNDATVAGVQAILRNLQFGSAETSMNVAEDRVLTITFDDNDGNTASSSLTIDIQSDPPPTLDTT